MAVSETILDFGVLQVHRRHPASVWYVGLWMQNRHADSGGVMGLRRFMPSCTMMLVCSEDGVDDCLRPRFRFDDSLGLMTQIGPPW